MSRFSLIARSVFLIGFVVAMPLLALPSVSRQLDELLYGKSKAQSPLDDLHTNDDRSQDRGEVAQATFVTPLEESLRPRDSGGAKRGLDAAGVKPPPLASTPNFPSVPTEAAPHTTAIPAGPRNEPGPALDLTFKERGLKSKVPHSVPSFAPMDLDEPTGQRLGEIRQRLEDLGADYVVLEAVDGTGQFRFLCRMLISPESTDTESFEASGQDAIVVAEQVLNSVQAWRASQASPPR
jgi:hypothetical protein